MAWWYFSISEEPNSLKDLNLLQHTLFMKFWPNNKIGLILAAWYLSKNYIDNLFFILHLSRTGAADSMTTTKPLHQFPQKLSASLQNSDLYLFVYICLFCHFEVRLHLSYWLTSLLCRTKLSLSSASTNSWLLFAFYRQFRILLKHSLVLQSKNPPTQNLYFLIALAYLNFVPNRTSWLQPSHWKFACLPLRIFISTLATIITVSRWIWWAASIQHKTHM